VELEERLFAENVAELVAEALEELSSRREIALSVNGRELGRVTAADNREALDRYDRRIALGYGIR
jgi:hypothetical protein